MNARMRFVHPAQKPDIMAGKSNLHATVSAVYSSSGQAVDLSRGKITSVRKVSHLS